MTDSGSMTNLSEAMIEAGKQAYTDWQQGRYPAQTTLPEAIYTAMQQAATPAAPVPNDDPMVRDVEEWLRTHPPDQSEAPTA